MMLILSSISGMAGSVRAQELVPPGAEIIFMRATFPKTDFGGNLLIEVTVKKDSNKNIIGAGDAEGTNPPSAGYGLNCRKSEME